jgi:hypothetical protein
VTDVRPEDVHTRGALLRRAEDAIATAERGLTSVRRTIPPVLWSLALVTMVFAQTSGDLDSGDSSFALLPALGILWWVVARLLPGRAVVVHGVAALVVVVVGAAVTPLVENLEGTAGQAFFLTVWLLLAAGTAWSTWAYVAASRRLVGEIDAWRSSRRDPALRALDGSDVTVDVATVHDLRDRADYDEVVPVVLGRDTARQFGLRTVKPVFALMVTGVLGLAFLLAPALGLDDSRWALADAASGLLLVAPWAWAGVVDMNRAIRGRQLEADRTAVESHLYAVRRRATTGAVVSAPRRPSLLGTPAGPLLIVAWVGVLVVRLRTSSTLSIIIAAVILAIATAVVAVRYVQRSRQTRMFPLAGAGPSVLQSPPREVVLGLTADGLTISDRDGLAEPHTVPLADIVSVEPLAKVSALSPTGVGIVTRDAPVVIVGRSVADDPAVVGLRNALGSAD